MRTRPILLVVPLVLILLVASQPASSAPPPPSTNRLITYADLSPPIGADGNPAQFAVSDDGSKVAFEFSHANDADPNDDLGSFFTDNTGGFGAIFLYNRGTQTVSLVSHAHDDPNGTDDAGSGRPAITGDGNWVSFASSGTDVVAGFDDDTNAFNAIYLRNVNTDTTVLVSHAASGNLVEPNGSTNGDFAVSADGSRIAYRSIGTDVVNGFTDNNGGNGADVYLWDRNTLANTLVSHAHNGLAVGSNDAVDYFSELPLQISDDGRYVAYTSQASNLVPGFTDNNATGEDIYLYDSTTGQNTLVTHGATTSAGSDGTVSAPQLAGTGSRVAYESTASNLVTGFVDNNAGGTDVFAWTRSSNSNRLVTFSATEGKKEGAGPAGGFGGSTPLISRNGKAIAYESDANDLVSGHLDGFSGQDDIWMWKETVKSGKKVYKNSLITHKFDEPKQSHFQPPNHLSSFSEDGKRVVFQSGDPTTIVEGFVNGNGSNHDIYVYDTSTKLATLVSRAFNGPLNGSNGQSSAPPVGFYTQDVISSDGKVIVLPTASTNIVDPFTNTNGVFNDLYVFGPPVT